MKNNGYKIDYTENTIIVTKNFLKRAGVIGSEEYTELVKVRKDFPDFEIVQREINKKEGKKTYGKLTYKVMEQFIMNAEEKNEVASVLAEFKRVQQLSKVKSGPYAYVKTWFLKRYENEFSQEETVPAPRESS